MNLDKKRFCHKDSKTQRNKEAQSFRKKEVLQQIHLDKRHFG